MNSRSIKYRLDPLRSFRLAVMLMISATGLTLAEAQTIRVSANATPGTGPGTTWLNAYSTLDPAIAAAPPGAQIWVAGGAYKPTNQLTGFMLGKSLQLYGAFLGIPTETAVTGVGGRQGSATRTILEGDMTAPGLPPFTTLARHVITIRSVPGSGGVPGVVIDGFTIRNGFAQAPVAADQIGGGISCTLSDLGLANCFVTDCTAVNGGGLYFAGDVTGFIPNTLQIKTCEFTRNLARASGVAATGGNGGGIFGEVMNGEVVNSKFIHNSGEIFGAGVYLWKMGSANVLDMTNCVFFENALSGFSPTPCGGGIYLDDPGAAPGGNAKLVNCTFHKNDVTSGAHGGAFGVSTYSLGKIYNSIFWKNGISASWQPISGPSAFAPPYNPVVDYSDVEWFTVWPSVLGTNVSWDPQFVSMITGDLRLTNSLGYNPCIDNANSSFLPSDNLDIDLDGNTSVQIPWDLESRGRVFDEPTVTNGGNGSLTLDMGAYEYP